MELAALEEVLDQLAGAVTAEDRSVPTGEEMVRLFGLQSRLQAITALAASDFNDGQEWATSGARSGAAWLVKETRLPDPECRRAVRLGRRIRALPHAEASWLEGRIGQAQAAVLCGLGNRRTMYELARSEESLVAEAERLRFEHFAALAAYWRQLADPDGADEDEEGRRNRRDAWFVRSVGGMVFGKATLDPVSGEIVVGELDRLERQLFEADWAEAKARLGRDPKPDELERSAAQRRADALVEMATRSRSTPPDAQRPAPLFSVFVDYEALHGRILQLANGTVLAPQAVVPWLDEAYIERAVFRPDRRVEVSERARLFTGATRRAVELRDRRCQHPYCDRKLRDCQVDHIVPYELGGPTTQENGQLLCGPHNRAKEKDRRKGRPPPAGP
jgi:hypothetical protein